MVFPIAPSYRAAILRQYDKNLAPYPLIKEEADAFLLDKEESFSLCLKYLYGHMAAQDVLSATLGVLAGYVQATLEACRQIDYLQTVPPEIFFPYVLYHRVNSECLDNSRGFFLEQLLPHVQGKSMEQAALSVNYWCYAHATYTPADDRTLGPLAVLRRTYGRCGEESVLAVAALRSVGIPARQCYCPRWSHCDDNHAWVEVWIDGNWHYLGACEPEPVLDHGWFTAAASRAMLVDTKCWADWKGDKLYETVNCISRYTDAQILTVQITEDGLPVAGARVCFQIVNYGELFTLWETLTDQEGLASFETGPGDLFVFAHLGQKVALEKVDLRQQNFIRIQLQEGFPEQITADLVPPADSSRAVSLGVSDRHKQLMSQCEAYLAARRAVFDKQEGYLRYAAGNAAEIQSFLEHSPYPLSHKEALLRTLRPKDFADISQATLDDALSTAEAARDQYPEDIYQAYILAPRIADEMLLPERQSIRRLFPDGFADPSHILAWMQNHMQILPYDGITNYYPSALGCLRCRQVPAFAFGMVFVALCRAFCFPARLESSTRAGQWMGRTGVWHSIRPVKPPVQLTLELPSGKKLNYGEHLTLGLWNGRDFATLAYPELTVASSHTFRLQPGLYRVTATTRQIDGTASTSLWHLMLTADQILCVTPPKDQTSQRLKKIPLSLPDGTLRQYFEAMHGQNLILIFADPGSEPTEHLLQEMLECLQDFRSLGCRILLMAERSAALKHPTVQRLKEALPEAELSHAWDSDALAALHQQMQIGDLRLPFVVCTDNHGFGVYADANYRIRMAQTLLDVQKLLIDCPSF